MINRLNHLVLLVLLLVSLVGCGLGIARILGPPSPMPAPAPQPTPAAAVEPGPEPTSAQDLRDAKARAEDERDQWQAKAKSYDRQLHAVEQADLAAKLRWLAVLCFIGCGVSIAAFVWLPVGKRLALGGAVAFLAVAVIALSVTALLSYMLWIALGLLGIGGLVALWIFGPQIHALHDIAAHTPDHVDQVLGKRSRKVLAKARDRASKLVTQRLTR